jgi:serine/threonine protein kinase
VDIWALGIILYELLTSRNPFQHENIWAMSEAIRSDPPAPITIPGISIQLKDLIVKLLDKNPNTRPDS